MALTTRETITLDGSGEYSDLLSYPPNGYLLNVLVNKNGQTGNPTVAITESGGLGRTILTITQTATGDNIYPVRQSLVTNNNTAITNSDDKYLVETNLSIAIASGDAAGTVAIQFQYEPI